MKSKLIIALVVLILTIPNTPIVGTEILYRIDEGYFRYANSDASYTSVEHIDVFSIWMNEWAVWGFIEDQRPTSENMEVFRLYKINPLCFWRWRYYIAVSRNFRYKNWKDIEPNRVPYDPENIRWQKF